MGAAVRRGWISHKLAVAGVFLAIVLGIVPTVPVRADPALTGEWSAPFDLGVIGIHSILLPTGKVLLFSYPSTGPGSAARVFDPATGTTTDASITMSRDVFCAGHSLLPDGRVFVTGGHLPGTAFGFGAPETDFFTSPTTWTSGPLLDEARWYPTNVPLANGRTLIFGGDVTESDPATSVESYDPISNTITVLPSSANRDLALYPRMHLLPNGRIAWVNHAKTRTFNPNNNLWSGLVDTMNFGSRGETLNSVALPGLNEIMVIGGANGQNGTTATTEIIDFSEASPQWRYSAPMNAARENGNAVVLPDGTVLMVGGGLGPSNYRNPVFFAELYDPVAETWTVMDAQVVPRMYHSTALLLPDGRVLSAGQDRGQPVSNHRSGEIFSPPYLFKGPRPTITSSPASVGYGQQFAVTTPDASSISRVALLSPGSVTHAIDMGQRYVDLSFSGSGTTLTLTAPANGNVAPPGPYMLFILNDAGVPSVASWVQVG